MDGFSKLHRFMYVVLAYRLQFTLSILAPLLRVYVDGDEERVFEIVKVVLAVRHLCTGYYPLQLPPLCDKECTRGSEVNARHSTDLRDPPIAVRSDKSHKHNTWE
jgi:hypothetical protein